MYAFGVMMWELMAKEMPFDGVAPADIRARVMDGACTSRGTSQRAPQRVASVSQCALMERFAYQIKAPVAVGGSVGTHTPLSHCHSPSLTHSDNSDLPCLLSLNTSG